MLKNKRFNAYIYPLLLLVLSIVMHRIWFSPNSILTAGDWGFSPNDQVRHLWETWSSWTSFDQFGASNVQLPFYGFMAIWGGLAELGLSYTAVTKITIFVPIALLIFLTPYYLCLKLTKNRPASFVAAIFYATTTYGVTNQPPIHMVYALTPLIILLFIKLIEKPTLKLALGMSVIYTIGIIYEVRIMYIVTFMLAVILLFFSKSKLPTLLRYLTLAGIGVILLNLFWILPTLDGSGATAQISTIANTGLFASRLFDLAHSLALSSWNWNGHTQNTLFIVQTIVPNLWIIPAFIFGSLIAIRSRERLSRPIIAFLILSVVGIFLTKEVGYPLPHAYQYLYDNFPGFNLFREASKFYLVTAIGYMGLIAISLSKHMDFDLKSRKKYRYSVVILIIVAAACLFNLKPFFTGEIQDLYVTKHLPSDYAILDNFLAKNNSYSRTLWTPTKSRWGYYTELHPKINAVDVKQTAWSYIDPDNSTDPTSINNVSSSGILSIFHQDYSQQLFDDSDVQYVIVPIRDTANNDDFFTSYGDNRTVYVNDLTTVPWLKRINIGTKQLAIYENKDYKPYFYATTETDSVDTFSDIGNYYDFKKDALDSSSFDFVATTNSTPTNPSGAQARSITDISNNITRSNIKGNELTISKPLNDSYKNELYVNTSEKIYGYQISNNSINVTVTNDDDLTVDNSDAGAPLSNVTVASSKINLSSNYLLSQGSTLYDINTTNNSTRTIGASNDEVDFYSSDKNTNLIINGNFDEGLWHSAVSDCNDYDNEPSIGMKLSSTITENERYSLDLVAIKHTACTSSNSFSVSGGESLSLSYDYQIKGGQRAGYDVVFNNPTHTIISADQIRGPDRWYNLYSKIQVPEGATSAYLRLKGYPDDLNEKVGQTFYDSVSIEPLSLIANISPELVPSYKPIELSGNTLTATLNNPKYTYKNLIKNPSLESGLWQKKVGDCNNYDNHPILGMELNRSDKTDGKQSLELDATSHIACTGPSSVSVTEGQTYLLSFDYKSPTKSDAGYYVAFNDPNGTFVNERLTTTGSGWQHFSKLIVVPYGANSLNLTVYSYADTYGGIKEINLYDNFSLLEVPSISNRYYLVSTPTEALAEPKQVSYKILSTTKKSIEVQLAKTPFYLNMSEGYSSQWRLELNDPKLEAGIKGFLPGGRQISVPENDHYNYDNSFNTWYVDPTTLCKSHSSACKKNIDGSYNISLIAEYVPQRSFNLGLIISCATLLAIIVTILGISIKKHSDKSTE